MPRLVTLTIRLGLIVVLLAGTVAAVFLASIPLARMESAGDLPLFDNSQAIAIDNANIITMVGNQVLRNRQLRIENGLITEIVAAGSTVDPRFKLVDANNGWLLPGLFDMHVHVHDRKYQVLSLTFGVTTVRNMAGYPFHLRWAKELKNGDWLGSTLLSASPVLNDPEHADALANVAVSDVDKARQTVKQYKSDGWDYINVHANLAADVYRAIIDEAEMQDIPVVGQVPFEIVEQDYRLAGKMRSLEHAKDIFEGPLDASFDGTKLERTAQELAAIGATVTPTLMIFDHQLQLAEKKQVYLDSLSLEYLNPLARLLVDHRDARPWLAADQELQEDLARQNSFHKVIVRRFHRNKVNMVLGSNSGALYTIQGMSTHDEMDLMVNAGLSPWSVLKNATTNAARVASVDKTHGSVEIGKKADLLLVWENPLFDLSVLREPRAVFKNGQYLDRERILELRVSSLEQSHPYRSLGRLLEFQTYR